MLAASIISPQFIAGVIIVIVILCIIGSCIRIVPQAHAVMRTKTYYAAFAFPINPKRCLPFCVLKRQTANKPI